ncbi:proline-rich receptor-like protein kinase PERK15 [Hevea brasiliensis]|uniref:proline-rich receptor-like protein kinase PERK15 n=1 Tax=Hevea brasiliensis TaxID=3981 RepID=UPI00260064BE|nr:proline-rich receptor-like protein kinase PERK15 [Hevea brasiliensis]
MPGTCFCRLFEKKKKANRQPSSEAEEREITRQTQATDDNTVQIVKVEERDITTQATDDNTVQGVPSYAFEVLAKATGNFSNNNRLGAGGYGQVYKGKLPNGKVVAIKRLIHHSDSEMEENAQLQFEEEVKTISRIRHRHIVEVVGYCSNKADRLLVYEFVSNNSLKYHLREGGKTLHGMESPAIDWSSRMKIALGTAKGLAYSHEDCKPRIIHRDIKSDNILLDDNFNPKIGDFGISKDFADSATYVFTEPRGTVA